MKTTSIDLNLLGALEALLAEQNVTRAGRRVGLSQPAMSEALARLRRHFGDELLTRVGNRYELTPLGASLRASAAAAMTLVKQTFATACDFDPATCEREFTLLASDYAACLLARELARAVNEQAPRARLRLGQLPAEGQLGAVGAVARGVDGFLLPWGTTIDGFLGVSLFNDRWICLAAVDNPVTDGPLTIEAMAAQPWVVHQAMERTNPVLDNLRAHGVEPKIELVVGEFHLLPELVCGSARLCVVQERLFARSGTRFGLRVLDLPFDVAPVVQALWWHPAHTRDPSHRWLRGVVAAVGRRVGEATDAYLPCR